MKIGLIDYGAGNLHSVENALKSLGHQPSLVRSPEQIDGLSHLLLPGVGSFGDCARKLRSQALAKPICDWIASGRPFFGICVGLQILFESSEESPGELGLGVFKGTVTRFPESHLKVPHMGWNPLKIKDSKDQIWTGLPENPHLYFVHSYFARPEDESIIAASCDYGVKFCAAVRRGPLFACQFHPEKSQKLGAKVISNFLRNSV